MKAEALALPSSNLDLWPETCLESWERAPQETFESWLGQLRIKGYRTVRDSSKAAYASFFHNWVTFLEGEYLTLLEASPSEVALFFKQKELNPYTRRRYLALLNRVYNHLIRCGGLQENPFLIPLMTDGILSERTPEGLEDDELTALIEALEELPSWRGARDRAMLALTVGAGLRVCALIQLRQQDVSLSPYKVEVRQSGIYSAHQSIVLPGGPWRRWLSAWISQMPSELKAQHLMLPATISGRAYTQSGIFRRISGWFDRARIAPPSKGVNLLRNTFIRLALESGRYTDVQLKNYLGLYTFGTVNKHAIALRKG